MRLVFAGVTSAGDRKDRRRLSGAAVLRRRVGWRSLRRLSGGAAFLQACRVEESEAFPPTARVCKKLVQFRKNGFSQVRLLAIFEASHE